MTFWFTLIEIYLSSTLFLPFFLVLQVTQTSLSSSAHFLLLFTFQTPMSPPASPFYFTSPIVHRIVTLWDIDGRVHVGWESQCCDAHLQSHNVRGHLDQKMNLALPSLSCLVFSKKVNLYPFSSCFSSSLTGHFTDLSLLATNFMCTYQIDGLFVDSCKFEQYTK